MDLKILLDTPPFDWPEGVGRTFKRLLRDPSSNRSERLIAAELGGDLCVMDDDMAETLLRVLKNAKEPEELRAKAAISLGPSLEMAYMELDEETEGFEDAESVPISEEMFRRVQQSLREVYLDTGTPRLVRRRVGRLRISSAGNRRAEQARGILAPPRLCRRASDAASARASGRRSEA